MPPDARTRELVSLVLITRNAGGQLRPCLESGRFADEMLVVDSGSADDTVQIAASFGARVIHQSWLGFGRQKQFAVEQAAHDWVLCLDADERLSGNLQSAIQGALVRPDCAAYRMRRCNRFLGRWLRHGEGYPDWSVRLFDRRRGCWSDDPVHERVRWNGPLGNLAGDLLHESADSLDAYLDKQNRYTSLQAEAAYAAGKRPSVARLLLSPIVRFLRFYVLRLGFLDGVAGLVHILIGCANSFTKQAKLFALVRNAVPDAPVRK